MSWWEAVRNRNLSFLSCDCQATTRQTLCSGSYCGNYFIGRFWHLRPSLSSPRSEAMSLACLACHGVDSSSESFRRYSTSDSDGEGRCGARINCWSRKTPVAPPPEITNSIMSSRVAPQPAVTSQGSPGSPRLMRCHAVRRDIFRDWHFDETIEEGVAIEEI